MGTNFIQNWLAWLSLSSLGPTQLTKDDSLRPWNSIWNAHHCELQEKLPHSMSFDSHSVSTKWGVTLVPHLLFHDYQFGYKRIFIKPWKLIFFPKLMYPQGNCTINWWLMRNMKLEKKHISFTVTGGVGCLLSGLAYTPNIPKTITQKLY